MIELEFEGDNHKEALIPHEAIEKFQNQDHLYQLKQINPLISLKDNNLSKDTIISNLTN